MLHDCQPDLSYAHGADTPRVTSRIISPQKLSYVEGSNVQGVYLDTKVTYNMVVTCGTKDQPTNAELNYAVAKDPVDNKWKIAGYDTHYNTTEYKAR